MTSDDRVSGTHKVQPVSNTTTTRQVLRSKLVVVLCLALAAGALVTSPVSAESIIDRQVVSTDPIQNSPPDETGDDLTLTAESYASDYNVSVEEATRRLREIDSLRTVIAEVRGLETARLAGWGVEHEPSFFGWVYLTGNAPPTDSSLAIERRTDEFNIELGAQYTYTELLSKAETKRTDVLSLNDRVTSIGLDMRNNRIEVGYAAETEDQTDAQAEIRSLENELNRIESTDVYSVVSRPQNATYASFKGGEVIDSVDGNLCTSGFAVHRNGTRGFLTAGHCRVSSTIFPAIQYAEPLFAGVIPATPYSDVVVLRNTVFDSTADAMWYSIETSDVTTDDFNVSANLSKDVNGKVKRINQLGDYVCAFGSAEGRNCGTVTDIFYAPCGGCLAGWALVEGSSIDTCFGDSGGPIFRSRKAYGIITGGPGTCGGSFNYMPIDYVELKLDVTLLTS